MMRTLIATAAATLFTAATVLFGAGVAKADCPDRTGSAHFQANRFDYIPVL